MFNIVEQNLVKMVLANRAPTVSDTEMPKLFQIEAVADTILKSILSKTGLFVPVLKTVGKVEDRTVEEYRMSIMEEPSMTDAANMQLFALLLHHPTRPLEIQSDFESPEEPHLRRHYCCSLPCHNQHGK